MPRQLLAITLLVGLISAGFGPAPLETTNADELSDAKAQAAALEQKIAKQKRLVADLNAAQADLRAAINASKRELQGVTADLAITRERVGALKSQAREVQATYEALIAELEQLDKQVADTERKEAGKKRELTKRQELLADRIRDAYEAERTTLLEILLSGDSFTEVLAEMSYQLDLAERDRDLAIAIAQDRETLAALRENLVATRDQTRVLRQETETQKRDLEARLAELRKAEARLAAMERRAKEVLAGQRAAYETLAGDERELRGALAKAAAAKKALTAKIDRIIAEQAKRGQVPSAFNGTLRWPMPGSVSQNFGCTGFGWEPTIGNCQGFHQGIDIVAPYGTPVRAAGSGRVAYVGWNYADGADPAWIVIIAHSQSLETWYAHMQGRAPSGIRAGARVEAGQIIGWEGNTGRSTGAHLHWAVRRNRAFVNPGPYL